MLSPLDLKSKKVEPKKRRYYDKDEMDEYLEFVFENYKELYNTNQELQKNIKTLNDNVQYYKSIESTMQKALVLAEKTAKETKDAAQLKAEAIEKDAHTRAEKIVTEAEQEYGQLKDKCLYLVQQFNQYKLQLKQVASAQLELVTSDSFDVYSPELEAVIPMDKALASLPENTKKQEKVEKPKKSETVKPEPDLELELEVPPESEPELELELEVQPEENSADLIVDESVADSGNADALIFQDAVLSEPAEPEESELDKTMIVPDVKKELSSVKIRTIPDDEINMDILTADTIDLSSSIQQIKAQESAVLDLEPVEAKEVSAEALESQMESRTKKEKNKKEAPTLDSLLQSISVGKKNKKKKGQDEDPFEFLGSVDDF